MKTSGRRSLVFLAFFALIGVGALLATAAVSSKPPIKNIALPTEVGSAVSCDADAQPTKEVTVSDLGTFQMSGVGANPIVAVIGKQFKSKTGLKTVPLQIIANGGVSFAEGIGETRFWLDPTRPVQSAIWEKTPGTEFPAIQEMRFHFFFTMEAKPGKLYRTMNPSIMRSDKVTSFPPPSGTVYRLMQKINLEDVTEPGVVAAQILSNRVVIPKSRLNGDGEPREL